MGHTSVPLLGGRPGEAAPPRAVLGGWLPEGPTGRGSGSGTLRPHAVLAGALPQTRAGDFQSGRGGEPRWVEQAEPRRLVSLSLEPEVQGLVSRFGWMEWGPRPPGVRTLPSGPESSRCQSPPRTPLSGHDTLAEGEKA
ncbi:hypothetical protein R6Z07F_018043 [Ovis aries]